MPSAYGNDNVILLICIIIIIITRYYPNCLGFDCVDRYCYYVRATERHRKITFIR